MKQGKVDPEKAKKDLETMGDVLDRERYLNIAGFLIDGQNKNLFDDTKERRDQVIQEALEEGGFRVLFAYNDILTNQEANDYIYAKWAEHTRARISDPVKRDILAPLKQPHPFGGKRPSLEQE